MRGAGRAGGWLSAVTEPGTWLGMADAGRRRLAALAMAVVAVAVPMTAPAADPATNPVSDAARLVGSWQSGPVRLTLNADASYVLTGAIGLPDQPRLTGRWILPRAGDKLVIRITELNRGATLALALPQPDRLVLTSPYLLGGRLDFVPAVAAANFLGSDIGVLIGLTLIVSGFAAVMTGQAVANGWGSAWSAAAYAGLLAIGDRFLHYALFEEELLSPGGFLVSLVYLTTMALLAHRVTRVHRMVTQYPWLLQRAGPFAWRERPGTGAA